ncbi:winged helix-turn-helix domain-containing protein [Lactobacillus crispatus]|uniref:winged helix-turn-helix domain-containing protein n=1 Tax=Lactobacillus crispatus TaxID=47770 RepID=UPI003EB9E16B
MNLPEELVNLRYPSKYHDLVAISRVAWALSDLKLAGLLISPIRSIYKISDTEKLLLNKYGLNITRELVHSQPAYIEHQKKFQEKSTTDEEVLEEQTFELAEEKKKKDEYDKLSSELKDAKDKKEEQEKEQKEQAKAAAKKATQIAKQSRQNESAQSSRSTATHHSNGGGNHGDLDTAETGKIVGNVNSKIYHVPGQAGYHMNSANAVYFNSEQDAINAGYRKAKR